MFSKYSGSDDRISYQTHGKAVKPSSALLKYLKGASTSRSEHESKIIKGKYKEGKPWKQFDDGEQHNLILGTMIKMLNDRKTVDEVISRAYEYQEKYLSGEGYSAKYEQMLMDSRLKWAVDKIASNKIAGKVLKPKKKKKKKKDDRPAVKGKKKKKGEAWRDIVFQNGHFDQEKSNSVKDLDYLGFVGKGHHTVMYGASGTMKTTVAIVEMAKELLVRPELEIFFYSFDASSIHHRAIFEWVKKQKVGDRFHILSESTPTELFDMVEQANDDESDMSNTVFIIDTYKKIVGDVNNKSKNAEVMTDLKSLTTLGATILTIAHANKDGINNSGTAEVEQDSDALIRFDTHSDSTGTFISITQGGRIRYGFQPLTYFAPEDGTTDYSGLLKKLVKLDSFVSTDSLEKEAKDFEGDKEVIDVLCDIISMSPCRESDILTMALASDKSISNYISKRVLDAYTDKKWRKSDDGLYRNITTLNKKNKKDKK